jgi:hypothetical protein
LLQIFTRLLPANNEQEEATIRTGGSQQASGIPAGQAHLREITADGEKSLKEGKDAPSQAYLWRRVFFVRGVSNTPAVLPLRFHIRVSCLPGAQAAGHKPIFSGKPKRRTRPRH